MVLVNSDFQTRKIFLRELSPSLLSKFFASLVLGQTFMGLMGRQHVSEHPASMWCVASSLKAALAGKTLSFSVLARISLQNIITWPNILVSAPVSVAVCTYT